METEWEGKSKGTVTGYKIFVFFINKLGIRFAYVILTFVALYFCGFNRKGTNAIYYYTRQRLGYKPLKAAISVFKNFYVFGQTIIDKIAISSGLRDKFTFNFDGIENLKELLAQGRGGILISAHVGNFEVAEFFFEDLNEKHNLNLVVTDAEHQSIKAYFEKITQKTTLKFIVIEEDLSHIFGITTAVNRGELVCITGDRYYEGSKVLEADFLGAKAAFPAGPFQIAARLDTPIIFVYVMKKTSKHYHLYARPMQMKHRDTQGLLENYIEDLEWVLKQYPLQWFNYFRFWNEQKHTEIKRQRQPL